LFSFKTRDKNKIKAMVYFLRQKALDREVMGSNCGDHLLKFYLKYGSKNLES
jgi:hypothetical protein